MAAFDSFRFPACNFKKETPSKIFSMNFAHFLRTRFERKPPDDCFLCLPVNLRSFSEHLFYKAPLGNCLFQVPVAEFQPAYTMKNYFTGTFQTFCTRARSSHSKTFIYWKSLEIICEEVNLYWSCEMPTCKFMKKSPFTHAHYHVFYFLFLKKHHDYFFGRGFESVPAYFRLGNISKN